METRAYVETRRGWRGGKGSGVLGVGVLLLSCHPVSTALSSFRISSPVFRPPSCLFSFLLFKDLALRASTDFSIELDRLANRHIAARRWKIVLSTFPIRRLKVQNERAYVFLLLSFLKKGQKELSNHSIPKYEIKTKRKIIFSSAKEIERQHDAFPLPSPLD